MAVGVSIAVGGLWYWRQWSAREAERQANNREKLAECEAGFGADALRVLQGLESEGYRPWIRESWRAPAEQERAYEAGRSEIKLGFHNVTGKGGERRAFAVDVVERMDVAGTDPRYAVALARLAGANGMQTGIAWGLMGAERRAIEDGVRNRERRVNKYLKLGWDPCHVEPRNLRLQEALVRAGASVAGENQESVTAR